MKTTIDIPDRELSEAMTHTGAKTKREAVVTAIVEFNKRRRRERLAARFGTFDGFPTRDQVVARRRKERE